MSDRKINTIQALIRKAEGTDNESEKQSYYAKAEQLMRQYQIEEAELDFTREASQRSTPTSVQITVSNFDSPVKDQLVNLAHRLAIRLNCKAIFFGMDLSPKYRKYLQTAGIDVPPVRADVVGFESDLRFFEMMWTSLQLHLLAGLEPKPSASATVGENVATLHEAGVTWRRVVEILSPETDRADEPAMKRAASRFKGAYKTHCRQAGKEAVGMVSPVTYQRNFAEGYVNRIAIRWMEMDQQNRQTSTALALRTEEVEKYVGDKYGELSSSKMKSVRYDPEAQRAGRERANSADLSGRNRAGGSSAKGALS